MKSQPIITTGNVSQLVEDNQLILPSKQPTKFKFIHLVLKTLQHKLCQQLLRFAIYTLLVLLILSVVNHPTSSTIYSTVQMDQSEKGMFQRKQIPGLFPTLSTKWSSIVSKWSIQVIRGLKTTETFNQKSYQIQFKHSTDPQKPNLLYITKTHCNGHLIMNWQIYSSNIFVTDYEVPKDGMIIPNQPEDEKCIMQNGQLVEMLKSTTIWTITEENNKLALFLLIERVNPTQRNNLVMIATRPAKQ